MGVAVGPGVPPVLDPKTGGTPVRPDGRGCAGVAVIRPTFRKRLSRRPVHSGMPGFAGSPEGVRP